MYKLLLNWHLKDEMVKDVMVKWAQDFGYTVELEKRENLWTKDVKFIACYLIKENFLKMMYRWYQNWQK